MSKHQKVWRRFLAFMLLIAITTGCFPVHAEAAAIKSRYVKPKYAEVWMNILGAVETGGQQYGQRDYSRFIGPYTGSPNEHSCTAGAYQEYGDNLRQLLLSIQKQYPRVFKKLDKANIAADLKRDWDYVPYTVKPGSKKAESIVAIISSSKGKQVQDQRAVELLDMYLDRIKSLGVNKLRCALFMAECLHLGGYAAVERVVQRASNKNSLNSLRKSLYKDQKDTSNSYQIGDSIYQRRHELIFEWLKEYIPANARI